jgi:hypothetical protein
VVDESAIERQLADEWIDLRERQRRGGPSLEIATQEAIRRDLQLERGFGGVIRGRRAVPLGEREDAEEASHARRALLGVDRQADGMEMRAGVTRPRQEGDGRRGRACRPIRIGDAVMAARRADVLAQELAGLRIDHADMEIGPLHRDPLADPPGGVE